jgi:signal transduction histidine kinase
LPLRTRDVEVSYTALNLGRPDAVRFRYRLLSPEGPGEWHDAGNRREAIYTNLAPGSYRFEVSAANADGAWGDGGAATTFVIPPTFTQTRWFLALCVAGACGLLWIAYWLRSRQLASRLRARLEDRMLERERIARELHDTILQGVQGIILDSQTMASRLPNAEPVRSGIERTLAQAERALVEGRDRIRALRTPLTAVTDLAQSLREYVGELPEVPARHLAVSVRGAAQPMKPAVQDELYRIAREALTNAVRHAQARHIEALLSFEAAQFQLTVKDDGRGFDTSTSSSSTGHWGVVGMRERAERLGARFEIRSAPGEGTQVRISLPSRKAYVRSLFRGS